MKYFNLVFFFIIFQSCFSQENNPEIIKGELVKENFKELKIANIPDDNGGLFTVKHRKRQAIIRHYNSNLQLDIEYTHALDGKTILSAFVLNNELNFITYRIDKETKNAFFSSNIFDSTTKTIKENRLFNIPAKEIALRKHGINIAPLTSDEYEVSNPFENNYQWGFLPNAVITDFDNLGIHRAYNPRNTFQWGIKFSKNKKRYVIGFANFIQGKKKLKQKESYRFYFLNDQSQLLYDQVITLDHKDRNYYFYDIEVDEKSESFYFLGKHFPKGTKGVLKYPEYEYEIHRINKDATSLSKVSLNKLKINDLNLYISDVSNNVFLVGLYSNASNYSVEGLAYFSFDKTNLSQLAATHTKFSEQFFKDTQRRKEEYRNLYIDNLYETTSGELFVIGEERTTGGMVQSSGLDPFGTAYFYSDLLVAKLDVTGKIKWSRAINKYQTANSKDPTSFMSYTSYLSEKEEINVIFNASQKLKTLKDGSTVYNFISFKKVIPFHLNFNELGDFTHRELLSPEEKMILSTRNCLYDNLNKASAVFFLGKRVNKEMWTKFSLK